MAFSNAPEPVLYREIEIPAELLTETDGITYGGDIRIGDLTDNGTVDFIVYRSADPRPRNGGMKPCFLGAFDIDGNVLWSVGEGGTHPDRPGSVLVHDIDGDGQVEVVSFWHNDEIPADWTSLADVSVTIRDGATGELKREAAPEAVTGQTGDDANWLHQRLMAADFRGVGAPRDFVVKLGDAVVALDKNLEVLWSYQIDRRHYYRVDTYIPCVGDINGDGRDEVNGGFYLLSADGTPLWEENVSRNMDSVAISEWDDGNVRAVCSGWGQVLDEAGNVILKLGPKKAPHGQEVRVADFRNDYPGPEMVLRYNGHYPDVHVVSSETGTIVDTFQLNDTPNNTGMEPVYWNGPDSRALLFNGEWLWDLQTQEYVELPGLPAPLGYDVHNMSWYHCIPANVCGDEREEIITWDPAAASVYIYTQQPPDGEEYAGYEAGPRQYNARIMD